MEKMNCDIIRDLIPSYVDGICSEATKKCVEGHIEGCDECRLMLAACKSHMLSGENMEQKGLDGLKQIKGIIKIQNVMLYLLLGFLVFLGIWMFGFGNSGMLQFDNTILFVACALVNVFAGISYKTKKSSGKTEYILGAVSLMMSVCSIFLFWYVAKQARAGAEAVLGKELFQLGPLLERVLIGCFLIQIAFFLYNFIDITKYNKNSNWLLCLNMMGIFLLLEYHDWMHRMDNYETLVFSLVFGMVKIVAVGIIGVTASLVGTKTLNKRLGGAAADES